MGKTSFCLWIIVKADVFDEAKDCMCKQFVPSVVVISFLLIKKLGKLWSSLICHMTVTSPEKENSGSIKTEKIWSMLSPNTAALCLGLKYNRKIAVEVCFNKFKHKI